MRKIRFFVLLFRKVEEHGSVDLLNNGFMSILTFSCPFFSNFAATNRSYNQSVSLWRKVKMIDSLSVRQVILTKEQKVQVELMYWDGRR